VRSGLNIPACRQAGNIEQGILNDKVAGARECFHDIRARDGFNLFNKIRGVNSNPAVGQQIFTQTMHNSKILFLISILLSLSVSAFSQAGNLDATFDTDGIVSTPIGTAHDYGKAVATQPDGKILVAGKIIKPSDIDFALARYNSDGSPDTNFSGDGKETGYIPVAVGSLNSIAVQSDGKPVVAGNFTDSFHGINSCIFR